MNNTEATANENKVNNIDGNENVALLVLSCDKYEDAWEACFKSIERYWPNCPYDKYLLTETKNIQEYYTPHAGKICSVNVNNPIWSTRLHEGIHMIECEFVIVFLEDQWPIQAVNQEVVDEAVSFMKNNDDIGAVYFETSEIGGVKKAVRLDAKYNEIPFGAPYRLSCAPSVFRKSFLSDVTVIPESAWDFERIRSFDERGRSYRILEINGVDWDRLDELGAITRGKWVRQMKEYAVDMGIFINYEVRPVLSRWDCFSAVIKKHIFAINPDIIIRIQNELYKRKMGRIS